MEPDKILEEEDAVKLLNFDSFSGGLGSGFSANYHSLAAASTQSSSAASQGISSLGLPDMGALGTMDSDSIFQVAPGISSDLSQPSLTHRSSLLTASAGLDETKPERRIPEANHSATSSRGSADCST